jgi:type IV pilus assembly protein PilM
MIFSKSLIALDIGSTAIKLVELNGLQKKSLQSLGLEPLPPKSVVDGIIANQDVVSAAIKTLLKKLKIIPLNRRVSIGLSGSSILIKKISITTQKDMDINEQIFAEAEQHFQADMADIYFDFYQLPIANATEVDTEKTVILVGAKREMIEKIISTVRDAGLRTAVVECSAFSALNMYEYNYGISEGLSVIVDVGAHTTKISLTVNGIFADSREIPIAGEEYTRRIVEGLQVDSANAESLKIASSQGEGNTPPDLARIIGDTNEMMVQEIRNSIDYFLQGGDHLARGCQLSQIYLTGGGSRVLGLDATLAATLQVPVKMINPFQKIEINTKTFQMDYVLMQGHLFGISVGLGLRSFGDK